MLMTLNVVLIRVKPLKTLFFGSISTRDNLILTFWLNTVSIFIRTVVRRIIFSYSFIFRSCRYKITYIFVRFKRYYI